MLILIPVLLASFIPAIIIYAAVRKIGGDRPDYRADCTRALIYGLLSPLAVVLAAGILQILGNLAGLKKCPVLIREAYTNFILHSLVEEVAKFLFLLMVLKKAKSNYSWRDVTAFMVIVGIGFGLPEDVLYLIGSDVVQILVRGLLLMHGGYAFIMGYFYGKALYTGKKGYKVIAILLPFLLHGIYDFGLVPELLELNDNLAFISISMALVGVVVLIRLIVFFARSGEKEKYISPLKQVSLDNQSE